jgi:hypothetical protein
VSLYPLTFDQALEKLAAAKPAKPKKRARPDKDKKQ